MESLRDDNDNQDGINTERCVELGEVQVCESAIKKQLATTELNETKPQKSDDNADREGKRSEQYALQIADKEALGDGLENSAIDEEDDKIYRERQSSCQVEDGKNERMDLGRQSNIQIKDHVISENDIKVQFDAEKDVNDIDETWKSQASALVVESYHSNCSGSFASPNKDQPAWPKNINESLNHENKPIKNLECICHDCFESNPEKTKKDNKTDWSVTNLSFEDDEILQETSYM